MKHRKWGFCSYSKHPFLHSTSESENQHLPTIYKHCKDEYRSREFTFKLNQPEWGRLQCFVLRIKNILDILSVFIWWNQNFHRRVSFSEINEVISERSGVVFDAFFLIYKKIISLFWPLIIVVFMTENTYLKITSILNLMVFKDMGHPSFATCWIRLGSFGKCAWMHIDLIRIGSQDSCR